MNKAFRGSDTEELEMKSFEERPSLHSHPCTCMSAVPWYIAHTMGKISAVELPGVLNDRYCPFEG